MGEWQAISTAPRDKPILVYDGEDVRWAVWDETFETGYDEKSERTVHRGAWTDFTVASWGYEEYTELKPTHWRPLPSPPSGNANG